MAIFRVFFYCVIVFFFLLKANRFIDACENVGDCCKRDFRFSNFNGNLFFQKENINFTLKSNIALKNSRLFLNKITLENS